MPENYGMCRPKLKGFKKNHSEFDIEETNIETFQMPENYGMCPPTLKG